MIINNFHSTEQIREFAKDMLRGMIPSGVVAVNPKLDPVITMSTQDPSVGQVKIPCWLFVAYKLIEPVYTCCVCEVGIVGPVIHRRFGKHPACSPEHADASPVEVIRGTPRTSGCGDGCLTVDGIPL